MNSNHLLPPLALALILAAAVVPTLSAQAPDLDRAQALLDAGDPEAALPLIERALAKKRDRGRALLLRSTARFMLGEHERATADLEQAVKVDPSLRQAWLNLAAVEMSVERWDRAYVALERARDLDPSAADNDLNLGAVQLLRGKDAEAKAHFDQYLAANSEDAGAPYQVASNYAVAGNTSTAIEYLRQAVVRDERIRLTIRGDARFDYYHLPEFNRLLDSDIYIPPSSAHRASADFPDPYDSQARLLVDAVLEALPATGIRHEPTVEVARSWALIWGDMRIKVTNQPGGGGQVSVSAPAERYDPATFHRLSQRLFRNIDDRLTVLRIRRARGG